MQAKRLLTPLALIIAIALAGCGLQAVSPTAPVSRARADALYQSGQYADAAQAYQRLAAAAQPPARAGLLLRAGEAWAQTDTPERALQPLNAIPAGALQGEAVLRWALLSARLDLTAQRPSAALRALDRLTTQAAPNASQQSDVLKLRGQAQFALGEPVAAVKTLTQRAALLHNPEEIAANQDLIWQSLSQTRQSLTAANRPQGLDPTVAGWLALGEIGRTAWQEPYRFGARISAWQRQYPQHPANGALLQRLLAAHAQRVSYPDQIALVLPLSGRLATAADAVRDGLLAARYERGANAVAGSQVPAIRLYDTHGRPADAVAAYRQAVVDGAALVVGPLNPDVLTALVNANAITVPTLALTDLPQPAATTGAAATGSAGSWPSGNWTAMSAQASSPSPLLYQFGFEATDEARQAAERVVQDGLTRGVVLAPDTPAGQRMTAAFGARLQALGGMLLESETYKPGESDLATPIKRMLNLDLSDMRADTLESVLGRRSIAFQPRRRADVQFVFLVADNGEARLIRPQIRFNHGIGLPVYATSAVYAPDSNPDYDLDGVLFTQMPWALSQDAAIERVRRQLEHLWPNRYDAAGRYYALGFDAYRLVPLIAHLRTPLAEPVRGVTGILSIAPDHRIHRRLDWAVYRGGHVRPLATGPSTGSGRQ